MAYQEKAQACAMNLKATDLKQKKKNLFYTKYNESVELTTKRDYLRQMCAVIFSL